MKILVTGAAGRLGSCVCRLLADSNVEFLAVDKFSNDQVDYPIKIADLLDWKTCNDLLEGVDVLMHFANLANWDSGTPEQVYTENAQMNMNLFQSAARR